MKVDVNLNRNGNIAKEGETIAGQKTLTFKGFASDIMEDDAINTENSPALHNGISGLVWLFSGTDENFDPLTIEKFCDLTSNTFISVDKIVTTSLESGD